VLVISHDEKYFEAADRIIKLDYGKIISAPKSSVPLLRSLAVSGK